MSERADVHRKVLVADADQRIRSLVFLTLNSERTDVLEAGSADEALARVMSERLDVVLVDADLPEPGGADVCAQIKDAAPDVHTVLLVDKRALGAVPDDVRADAVLTKPFTSLALLRKVDELLEAG